MATPALHLTVDKGPKKGETLERKPGTLIRIGRVVKGNTFAIKDSAISQKHLVVKFLPEISRWVVEDLDTSNGTLVNDVRIDPSVPFPLSDGDTVKIGESTSISVKIDGAEAEMRKEEESVRDSRRNVRNRRGRSKKADEIMKSVTEEEKCEGSRGVVGNRRGRSKKAEEIMKSVTEEEKCEGSRGVVGNRRGRSKKAEDSVGIVEKDENLDSVAENTVEEPNNWGRGRPVRGTSRVTRGTSRVTRKAEVLHAEEPVEESRNSCDVSKEDELSDLVVKDSVEVPVKKSKFLRRGRPRKGDSSKISGEDEVSDLVVADSIEVPKDAGRMTARRAPAQTRASTAKVLEEEVVPEANLGAQEVAGKGKVEEGSDGGDECKVVGSGEEAMIGEVEEERIVDIEKMTLGEWFDSMEKFLPMAINDVAEEIILNLREKALRFDEFIATASDAYA